MSTIAAQDVLPLAESKPRASLRWISRNVWGLADQVLISGTNFATMLLVAKGLGKEKFGEFTLIYSALLLANILQSTLITQAHNVLGSMRDGKEYRDYTSSTAFGQLCIALIQALMASAVAIIGVKLQWSVAPLLLALPAAIVTWQFAEFVRRVLYTEGRLAAAFFNDLISYGGQAVIIAALWWTGNLTGARALWALSLTNFLASLVGGWQLRHHLIGRVRPEALSENWHFGKWLTGAELLGYVASLHMYCYLASIILSTTEAAGDLKVAQVMFGPARVISFFLATVLPIRFARTFAAGGDQALHEQVKHIYKLMIPLTALYCGAMALCAKPLLGLVGKEYAGNTSVLVLYSLCAFLSYVQMVVAAALTAKRETRAIFMGSLYGAIITLAVSYFLIKTLESNGAIVAMILTTLIVTAMYRVAYRRGMRKTEEKVVPMQLAQEAA